MWFDSPQCVQLGGGDQGEGSDHRRLHVQVLPGLLEVWTGGNTLQITGRHKGHLTALQMVLDEPPQALHNQWIKDRVEFYKRVEPVAAPRDERLELVGGKANRLRFSSTNGLGPTSDAIWNIILRNEEIQGLKVIKEVAKAAVTGR